MVLTFLAAAFSFWTKQKMRTVPKLNDGGEPLNTHGFCLEFITFSHHFRDMQRLNLARNELSKVPHSALAGLTYLETLELSDNPIANIQPGDFNGIFIFHFQHFRAPNYWLFTGLDNLDHLIMNHNKLEHLAEGIFQGMPKLTTLYLDSNMITTIHNHAFVGLEGICRFDKIIISIGIY